MEKDYKWIMSVIGSCKTPFQLTCCQVLIELFEAKYKQESSSIAYVGELSQAYAIKDRAINYV